MMVIWQVLCYDFYSLLSFLLFSSLLSFTLPLSPLLSHSPSLARAAEDADTEVYVLVPLLLLAIVGVVEALRFVVLVALLLALVVEAGVVAGLRVAAVVVAVLEVGRVCVSVRDLSAAVTHATEALTLDCTSICTSSTPPSVSDTTNAEVETAALEEAMKEVESEAGIEIERQHTPITSSEARTASELIQSALSVSSPLNEHGNRSVLTVEISDETLTLSSTSILVSSLDPPLTMSIA